MTRIDSIHVVPTTPRQSAPGRFETALQSAADQIARGVTGGLAAVAPTIPGGTILLGAVRAATRPPPGHAPLEATSPVAATGTAGAAGSSEGDLMASARALQAESQAFNAQYLQLQESMQRENREFTALSNVMKVKHDTARAAISNIH